MTKQHETFGGTLRRLRKLRGLSQAQLATSKRVTNAYGHSLTGAAVSEWERGETSPKNRAVVQALDDELDADGELLLAAGYNGPPGTDTEERLSAIEARMETLEKGLKAQQRDFRKLLGQQHRAADS